MRSLAALPVALLASASFVGGGLGMSSSAVSAVAPSAGAAQCIADSGADSGATNSGARVRDDVKGAQEPKLYPDN